jgi:hypothetical protein
MGITLYPIRYITSKLYLNVPYRVYFLKRNKIMLLIVLSLLILSFTIIYMAYLTIKYTKYITKELWTEEDEKMLKQLIEEDQKLNKNNL